jgi:predicted nucleic acid-binding Zn ribbon protein
VNWTATQIHQVRLGAAMEYGHAIPAPPARPMNRETFRADPGKAASAALPLDRVAASQRCERSSNKRSKSRRFRVPALANSILGLIVLALLFVFLYGPDKLVETVSPGYMCNQSAPEAIKVVHREAERLLSFGDFMLREQ